MHVYPSGRSCCLLCVVLRGTSGDEEEEGETEREEEGKGEGKRGEKKGREKKIERSPSLFRSLLPGCDGEARRGEEGGKGGKKRRRQRSLESRRGTKWQRTSLGCSRIVGYLAPRGHGGSSYRTLDMPVGGPTSTGAELPGSESESLRASRRLPTRGEERRADIPPPLVLPFERCRFYAPGMMPSLPPPPPFAPSFTPLFRQQC